MIGMAELDRTNSCNSPINPEITRKCVVDGSIFRVIADKKVALHTIPTYHSKFILAG